MASPYWQRRNAAARALGYKNYYDYRTHGYGAEPPEAPRPTGERLRRLRGHSSRQDFLSRLRAGRVELVIVEPGPKGDDGRYRSAQLHVTQDDGTETTFWLTRRQLDGDEAKAIGDAIRDAGVTLFDAYGLLGPQTSASGPALPAAA